MPLINCDNLSLAYEGLTVAENITFLVNSGNFLSIIGKNGSGKSTLVRCLLGLKLPSGGSLTFGDGLKPSSIGYLPQQNAIQRDFPASVSEVVMSGCLNKTHLPFYPSHLRLRTAENMKRLGLWELKSKCYRELSGGQQQRVLLARALCATDKLLLLDEPAAGLDPVVTAELYEIISELNRDGVTVIMVSHDVQAALKYSTHILHMGPVPLYFGTVAGYTESNVSTGFLGGGLNE